MSLSVHDNEARLRGTLAQVLELDPSTVDDGTSMDSVEAWDSLKQLFVILAIEEQFGVSLDEERAVEAVSLPLIREQLRAAGISF